MKHRCFALVLAFLLLLPASAFALYDGHFGDMDTNGDGHVVLEEFQAFFPDGSEEDFGLLAGDDGKMDHDEWHKYKEAHGLRHHGEGHGAGHGEGHKEGHKY